MRSVADEDQVSISQDECAPDAGCDQIDLLGSTDDGGQSGAHIVGQWDRRRRSLVQRICHDTSGWRALSGDSVHPARNRVRAGGTIGGDA